jgi:hypothetical protein
MADSDIEMRLRAALHETILSDITRSLKDPVNRFSEASDADPCKCYHNMNVAVNVLTKEEAKTGMYAKFIREHVTDPGRKCGHVWHYKQTRKAMHEYFKPREF